VPAAPDAARESGDGVRFPATPKLLS